MSQIQGPRCTNKKFQHRQYLRSSLEIFGERPQKELTKVPSKIPEPGETSARPSGTPSALHRLQHSSTRWSAGGGEIRGLCPHICDLNDHRANEIVGLSIPLVRLIGLCTFVCKWGRVNSTIVCHRKKATTLSQCTIPIPLDTIMKAT